MGFLGLGVDRPVLKQVASGDRAIGIFNTGHDLDLKVTNLTLATLTLGSWSWPLTWPWHSSLKLLFDQKYYSSAFITFDLKVMTLTSRSRPWPQGRDLDLRVMTLTFDLAMAQLSDAFIRSKISFLGLHHIWPWGHDLDLEVATLTQMSWPWPLTWSWLKDTWAVVRENVPYGLSRCHTIPYARSRARPSFGMTPTFWFVCCFFNFF